MGSVSSGGEGSARSQRSASFTPETTFLQGSTDRARNSKRKSKEKKIVHDHVAVVKFELKIHQSNDNQAQIMDRVGDLINVLKKKDKHMAIVN